MDNGMNRTRLLMTNSAWFGCDVLFLCCSRLTKSVSNNNYFDMLNHFNCWIILL